MGMIKRQYYMHRCVTKCWRWRRSGLPVYTIPMIKKNPTSRSSKGWCHSCDMDFILWPKI